jgi:hypothetical protein
MAAAISACRPVAARRQLLARAGPTRRAPGRRGLSGWPALVLACLSLTGVRAAGAGPAAAAPEVRAVARVAELLAERAALQPQFRDSVFGERLLLHTRDSDAHDEGEAFCEVPHPFARIADLFRSADRVCELLLLHLNVRSCKPGAAAGGQTLDVSAGPMREVMPGLVYRIVIRLHTEVLAGTYLDSAFEAEQGPLGSSALRLHLEAVAIDAGHTYLRLRYTQDAGLATRLAARLYLATAGRAKLGFSQSEGGAKALPHLIDGRQAAIERNAMRHYLGLLAYASVPDGPPRPRMEARLRAWHALTELHALQLHELDLAEYLHEKRDVLAGAAEAVH